MRAHYLQHVPFEGLGSIGPWLAAAKAEVTCSRFFAGDRLPDAGEVDLLVVMGGPMSVNGEAELPWLVEEKRFVRNAIESGVPALGVCLGAQLIASCLGARVYPNREKEIGWFPVSSVAAADGSVFRFPPSLEVFHWHGETFDLPAGAVQLARSRGCENQAFQLGRSVIGLQFHLETTPGSAQAIVEHCRAELGTSRYVQSEGEILQWSPARYAVINAVMGDILSYLVDSRS
jgi:GMP synthase-like glutamine amidotransferase